MRDAVHIRTFANVLNERFVPRRNAVGRVLVVLAIVKHTGTAYLGYSLAMWTDWVDYLGYTYFSGKLETHILEPADACEIALPTRAYIHMCII